MPPGKQQLRWRQVFRHGRIFWELLRHAPHPSLGRNRAFRRRLRPRLRPRRPGAFQRHARHLLKQHPRRHGAEILFKVNVPVLVSLGIVCGTLTFGVLLSIIFPKRSEESEEEEEAHEEIDMLQQDIEAGETSTQPSRSSEQLLF